MEFTNNEIDIYNNVTTSSSNDDSNKIDSDDEIIDAIVDETNASFGKVNMEDDNETTITEETVVPVKKLPYFHRVLSTTDTELIGSIAPKKIDPIVTDNIVKEIPSGSIHASSAWNAAQTWEERNFSKWAEDRIPDILVDDFEITTGTGTFQTILNVNKVDNIKGHASIAHVRGKARYIYEYSVDFGFDVKQYDLTTSSKITYSGKLAVDDICNDMDYDDINLILTWTKSPPSAVLSKIRSVVLGKDMKKKIKEKMNIFEAEFRNK
jgi:hypothetical protein